ncbi:MULTISPECIES: hypothetical protein [Rhizobium]|uniref:hypothetical protein n=1 Tax=Rhizobium TaxID=379 RepID=UPI00103177CD|nr:MULTISPECIES: hypothetical protein [Rhizobium]TBD43452.1 hypothetical protein ELH19_15085 [Rhizobium ruizarguesonis]TBY60627.1 hypothetical protein E0H39_23665 [Rhizobium leguminosarum bv. viciae]
MTFRNFPFDPLGGLGLPKGGLGDPQGGYLKTPVIRPIPTLQQREQKDVPKGNQTTTNKSSDTK